MKLAPVLALVPLEWAFAAGVSQDGRTLVCTRRFFFGQVGDQMLRFPVSSYPGLKGYFDEVSKHGGHAIALIKNY